MVLLHLLKLYSIKLDLNGCFAPKCAEMKLLVSMEALPFQWSMSDGQIAEFITGGCLN